MMKITNTIHLINNYNITNQVVLLPKPQKRPNKIVNKIGKYLQSLVIVCQRHTTLYSL